MRAGRSLASWTILSIFVAGLAGSTAPAVGGTTVGGKIAYALSTASGHSSRRGWIEIADLGTSEFRSVTPSAASPKRVDESPVLSGDGTRVAFVRASSSARTRGIYTTSATGEAVHKIATVDSKNVRSVYPLRWAPQDDRLVFDRHGAVECNTKKPFDLRFDVARADGHGVATIHALSRPEKLVELGDIRWSPDGTKLLYIVYELDNAGSDPNECRYHRPAATLYVVNADGSGRTRLVANREVNAAARSPDASQIAYVDCYDADIAGCDIYVIPSQGGAARRVEDQVIQPAADIAWSPRGDEILDTGYRGLYAFDLTHETGRTVITWPEADSTATLLDFSTPGDSVALISSYSYGADHYANRATISVVSLYGGTTSLSLVPAGAGRGRLGGVSVWLP